MTETIHRIAREPNLTLRVVAPLEPTAEDNARHATLFEVDRDALEPIRYFHAILHGGFKESHQSVLTLEDDDPTAMREWLSMLHGDIAGARHSEVTISTVWGMLYAADKYGLDPYSKSAQDWFSSWLGPVGNLKQRFSFKDTRDALGILRQLLFPCSSFDHSTAFAAVAKRLAYMSPWHISEDKPKTHAGLDGINPNHLHLRPVVIQQINAAKGRLKTILHGGLWKPIKMLVDGPGSQSSKEQRLYAYVVGLLDTNAFPVEEYAHKIGILELCARLEDYSPTKPFSDSVAAAVSETRRYFDGLCLNCMRKSKLADNDEDYWNHADLGVPWDSGCQLKHGEPSWYFSFMGRKERMIQWVKKRQESKAK